MLFPLGNINNSLSTYSDAEAPIFWPPDEKSQVSGRDPDAGKHWKQEEMGVSEDEMVGWHHQT